MEREQPVAKVEARRKEKRARGCKPVRSAKVKDWPPSAKKGAPAPSVDKPVAWGAFV